MPLCAANIQQRIEELRQTVDERRSEATAIGRSFWDDISVNADNADDLIETAASMAQQEHVLQGQERSYRLRRMRCVSCSVSSMRRISAALIFKERGRAGAREDLYRIDVVH